MESGHADGGSGVGAGHADAGIRERWVTRTLPKVNIQERWVTRTFQSQHSGAVGHADS